MRPLRHFSSLLALALPAFAAFKFDTEHDAHGDGGDSEWEPPHPSLILPEGQGWLETPEIKAFINSKYQCRRYEWAPTIQECRELLDQLPEDMPCMDRHVLFRPEDRITAAGGTGAGGCEIEIFGKSHSLHHTKHLTRTQTPIPTPKNVGPVRRSSTSSKA